MYIYKVIYINSSKNASFFSLFCYMITPPTAYRESLYSNIYKIDESPGDYFGINRKEENQWGEKDIIINI